MRRPSLLILLFLTVIWAASDELKQKLNNKRGIAPNMLEKYLAGGDKFKCFDGSLTVPLSAVNDDYCDCKDGSDEPGTPPN
jgi:protein kinase C substrate 80K-H